MKSAIENIRRIQMGEGLTLVAAAVLGGINNGDAFLRAVLRYLFDGGAAV